MSHLQYQPFKTFLMDHQIPFMRDFGMIGKKEKVDYKTAIALYGSYYRQFGRHMGEDMGDWVVMSEYRFLESDRYTVFPNSKSVLDSILRSKLNLTDFEALVPPAESFVVMMPQGYKTPSGVPLRSFLVQWADVRKNSSEYTRVSELSQNPVDIQMGIGGVMLDVIMMDANLQAIRMSCFAKDVLKAIESNDAEQDVFKLDEQVAGIKFDEEELKQTQAMIKLAVGLAVFDSAYDDFLIDGLPKGSKLKKVGEVGLNNSHVVGSNLKLPQSAGGSKSGHIRGFHMRQLKDERYYRGEHAHKKVGSRCVPVSESWVGDSIESHTTNESSISK
ncbi:hypothetical protein [Vibrio crassostreae]|uniref:hypothetical protein n=1 Tax=Vibrio crassostreae TaxID=246167 RepID=UPI001B3142DA|nr:hypothetical protein [Vibrio crassostreae]